MQTNKKALGAWQGIESTPTQTTTERKEKTMTILRNQPCIIDGCSGNPITHDPRDNEAHHELMALPGHAPDIHPSKLGERPWVVFVNIETGVELPTSEVRRLAQDLIEEADRVDSLNRVDPADAGI